MNDSILPADICIVADSNPQTKVVDLVESTVFGSEGLQYQRLDVGSQLERFNAPIYLHAVVGGELVGVYVLDQRDLLIGGKPATGYYRGVLAVASGWQGRGVGKQMTAHAMRWLSDKACDQPVVSYGCIDKDNTRSLALLESAGATIGPSLSMYMMYRQWPKVRCKLIALDDLSESHRISLDQLANVVYSDCVVRDVSPSRLKGFVLRDEKGVAVSARVAPTSFRIVRMSAMARWCTFLFVKPSRAARKRFNPDNFRYISFSDVLIRPGCEAHWPDFVSTVLASYDCHFAAVYIDPHSKLFLQLNKPLKFARVFHSSNGAIKVVWQGFDSTFGFDNSKNNSDAAINLWPIDA